ERSLRQSSSQRMSCPGWPPNERSSRTSNSRSWICARKRSSTVGHYKSNVRDLEFNLFEVLDVEKVLGSGQFGDLSADAVRDMIRQASEQAEGPLAEPFFDGDRQ